jgi:putative peptidoglycan lipid II flippase
VVSVLFLRGEFTAADAAQTSIAVRWFALGLWSVAAVRVLVPAYYALEDTRTPVVAATVAFLANFALAAACIGPITGESDSFLAAVLAAAVRVLGVVDLRHGGLALATSLSATVNLVVLCALLGPKMGGFEWRGWLASLARTGVATIAMVPVVIMLTSRIAWFDPGVPLAARLAWLLVAMGAGSAAYAAGVFVLGGPEVASLRARLRRAPR